MAVGAGRVAVSRAALQELREAVKRFHDAGRPVDDLDPEGYWLAAVAAMLDAHVRVDAAAA